MQSRSLLVFVAAACAMAAAGTAEEPADKPAVEFPPGRTIFAQSPTEKRIREALRQPAEFDYQAVGLGAVAEDIAKRYGIPVYLDEAGLTADGKGSETIFYVRTKADRLSAALHAILKPQSLTYIIADDRLLLTTLTAAETHTSARVYQVQDLVVSADGKSVDFEALIELIVMTIEPETWREVGGTQGDMKAFIAPGLLVLVIVQTEQVHDHIEQLLTDLRAGRDAKVLQYQRSHPAPFLEEFESDPSDIQKSGAVPFADPPRPAPEAAAVEQAVAANNQLAIELYRRLADPEETGKNMVFSPLGLLSALGPLYAGSAGTTEAEFREKLQLPAQDVFHPQMNALADWLRVDASARGHSLRLRNHLFVQHDEPLLASFVDTAHHDYGAAPIGLDFRSGTEAARERIERQIRDDSGGFIDPTGFAAGLNDQTRLAVLNTVDFRGKWAVPFDEEFTTTAPFHRSYGDVPVRMMQKTAHLDYARIDGWQVVRKRYGGHASGSTSLCIALPEGGARQFAKAEHGLTLASLDRRFAALERTLVELHLPKCTFSQTHDLAGVLEAFGFKSAFSDDAANHADFSAINGKRDLFVQGVRQLAKIDFNEKETRAAAATLVAGGFGAALPQPEVPIVFRCNRPFVFLIRDDATGTILFMGRVMSPDMAPLGN